METLSTLMQNVDGNFPVLFLVSGQGFAYKRKQKFKHDYNKLLHKERKNKNKPESKNLYKEEKYPEHLRHLYKAEAEKLKNETWMHRVNRSKQRMRVHEKAEEEGENADVHVDEDAAECQMDSADLETTGGSELTDLVAENQEPATATQKEWWGDYFEINKAFVFDDGGGWYWGTIASFSSLLVFQ